MHLFREAQLAKTTSESPVPVKLHTAVPQRKTAPRLARLYREHFKKDVVGDIELFAKHTNLNVRRVLATMKSLDLSRKWSSAVFLAGYHMGDAVKRLDVTACYDALAELENLTPATMYGPEKASVSSILSEAWEPSFVRHMREFTIDDGGDHEPTTVYPVLHDELETHRKPIADALQLIKKFDPEVWEEFESYVTRIKVFNGATLNGETSNVVFGTIWLHTPREDDDQVAYWVEHLVHEIAHLQLYVLSMKDVLVLNSPDERFPAPLRTDPRPMFGNFHATFVLARMLRIFRRLAESRKEHVYKEVRDTFTRQFQKGLAGISSDRAKLTPLALRIRDSMQFCALET